MRLSEIRRQRGKIQPLSKRKKGCPEVSAASGGYSEPEGLGCERGTTFEQSENGAASTLPPAGATTGQRGFAQRNGAERRQAPGCERGASRGTRERTPADPAGKCGATFEQSENGAASTLSPAGTTTGQRGFAAGEMEPNGDKRWAAARSRTSMRRMRRRRPLQPGRRFKGHTKKFAFQA